MHLAVLVLALWAGTAALAAGAEPPSAPPLSQLRQQALRVRSEAERRRAEAERQMAEAQALYEQAMARRQSQAAQVSAEARENARKALAAAQAAIEAWNREIASLDRLIAEQVELRARLGELRMQVRATQQALQRLNRSIQLDVAQLAEWQEQADRAARSAWDRGRSLLIDETLMRLTSRLDARIGEADAQIGRAVDRLAGETDPNRREQLHAAVRLLDRERADIRTARDLVLRRAREAKVALDTVDWAQSSATDLEKALTGVHRLVVMAVSDPGVQKALQVGGHTIALARYGKNIADSAYDISSELAAWKRINQLTQNSEEYLKAVETLSARMTALVNQIHEIETRLVP